MLTEKQSLRGQKESMLTKGPSGVNFPSSERIMVCVSHLNLLWAQHHELIPEYWEEKDMCSKFKMMQLFSDKLLWDVGIRK